MKKTTSNTSYKLEKKKIKRPGVHTKKKTSTLKTSKNYTKTYKGQGR